MKINEINHNNLSFRCLYLSPIHGLRFWGKYFLCYFMFDMISYTPTPFLIKTQMFRV